jgi:hypothetical protein
MENEAEPPLKLPVPRVFDPWLKVMTSPFGGAGLTFAVKFTV